MIGWLIWCFTMRRNRFVWKAVASIVGIQLLLCLELGDFPPFYWMLDAHALWHAGTWPLAFLWYRYVSNLYIPGLFQKFALQKHSIMKNIMYFFAVLRSHTYLPSAYLATILIIYDWVIGSVCCQVVKVFDFKPLAPYPCGFAS
jgi:hypothetical protein